MSGEIPEGEDKARIFKNGLETEQRALGFTMCVIPRSVKPTKCYSGIVKTSLCEGRRGRRTQ